MNRRRPVTAPSVAYYRVGGRMYPMRSVPQCRTCSSSFRSEIEGLILAGHPYPRIVDHIRGLDPDYPLTVESLREHVAREHLPLNEAVVRRVMDRQAEARGVDLAQAADVVVDKLDFAQAVLEKTAHRMAAGDLNPTITDGLNAAKLLAQFQEHGEAADEIAYVRAFMVYQRIAQEVMTEDQFAEFGRRLRGDEELAALVAEFAAKRAEAGEVVLSDADNDDFYHPRELPE